MEKTQHKPLRLRNWDYSSAAAYHVIVCTKDRRPLFGRITASSDRAWITPTSLGTVCVAAIEDIEARYEDVHVANYVVMPNHVHLLIELGEGSSDLKRVVSRFKSLVTAAARCDGIAKDVWQRSFYDHIIRGEDDYRATWDYIDANPACWIEDRFYVP